MARLIFDKNHQVDVITLVLETKAGRKHGSLYGVTDIVYKKKFNQPDELSFGVIKYIDGHINRLWNYIVDLKVIYIPEFQEKFEIKVSYNDDEQEFKNVTATSLCEAELSQIPLRNLEVNSPTDIDREDYKLTTFYNEDDPKYSLLHRVLSQKAPHYSIKFVDDTLKNLAFEFSANEKSIYDFLINDVAEKMQCVFIFDSVNRTISAFDLCSTCNDCYEEEIGKDKNEWKHYRGDFHDICPHCGSENILEGYGRNTSIMINRENFATSITKECDVDSLKNCFYVECDDELINAAFILANPNGSQYIYYFSDEILADMPCELVTAINEYNEIYNDFISSHVFDTTVTTHIYNADTETMSQNDYIPVSPDSNYVTSFNNVVNQVLSLSSESPYIDCKAYISKSVFTGQSNLVSGYYNAIDFESFLQTSMMPTYEMEVYNKYHALSLLNSANFGSVAIAGFGSATVKTLVDNAVLSMAKTLINTALFSVDIYTSSYSTGGTLWTGKFIITDLTNDDESTNTITNDNYLTIATKEGITINETIPASVLIQINGDYVTYSKNKIAKILAKEDLPTSIDLYNPETTLNEFNEQIKLHSIGNLTLFYDVLDSCAGVLQEEMSNIKDKSNSVYVQMNTYYQLYRSKMASVNTFIAVRNSQINEVKKYKALLSSYIAETQSKLDFKSFLKSHSDTLDLWTIFNCYRREDTYKNSNITSDNLKTNSEILQYAGHLMNFAKKELITAGTMQYSLSSSLNNLLLHKEFSPLVDVFEVGNWIRLRTDIRDDKTEDLIYKLRLLSYEIRFDDVQTINVTFSSVTKTINGINDIKSVLDSAKSMATSYTGIERQVEKSADISSVVSNWVTDGLDMTKQKIMNDIHRQELVIDSRGLLARKLLDMAGLYDGCQLRILGNGLYITHDGWLTIDTGIGKIYYTDPETGEAVEDYGIIAKTVIGKLFLGENLGIYTPNGSLKFDGNGLLITNGKNTVNINPNDSARMFKITKGNTDVFYTDADGNLNITGKITATSGNFSGNITGSTIVGGSINIGNGNFTVNSAGVLSATNGSFSGTITAGENSRLGKFNVSATAIYNNSSSLAATTGVYIGTDGISCGTGFKATKDGNAYMISPYISSSIYMSGLGYFDAPSNYKEIISSSFVHGVFYPRLSGIWYASSIYGNSFTVDLGDGYGCSLASSGLNISTLGGAQTTISGSGITTSGSIVSNRNINNYTPFDGVTPAYFNTQWVDGSGHSILSRAANGTDTTIGWNGIGNDGKEYTTCLVLRGSSVRLKSTTGTVVTSDERLKNSFKPLDEFESLFMDLKSFAFKYNNGTSNRYHFGFKAGDVKNCLIQHGYSTKDFAGFVQWEDNKNNDDYCGVDDPMGLIYSEFTAWNTHMIQRCIAENHKLKERITTLENKLMEDNHI